MNLSVETPGLGRFFYLIDPVSTSFERIDEIPNYFRQSIPYFGLLILVEYVIRWLQGKPRPRTNDTVTSMSLGLMQECVKIVAKGFSLGIYVYMYENYRLVNLPWDSVMTWYTAAILVDLGYYWVHRALHEFNILWSIHQVHHSSDEFTFAVGLRHGVLHPLVSGVLYAPVALFIPPAQFLTHLQFNFLFQFMLHTEIVERLGPLEWIFNTPAHHRVHHGSNKYLLDKNYGGVLIIWDRLFGTFQEKLPEETIYNLVFPPNTFNPISLQTYYYPALWKHLQTYDSWKHRIEAVIKGPSWTPGSPWTGWEHFKVAVTPRPKYDVEIPRWYNLYIVVHFLVLAASFQSVDYNQTNVWNLNLFIGYVIVSLTSFGLLFENDGFRSCTVELMRCVAFLVADGFSLIPSLPEGIVLFVRSLFYVSAIIWLFKSLECGKNIIGTAQPNRTKSD